MIVQQVFPSRLSNGPVMALLTVQPPTPNNVITPVSPGFPSPAVIPNIAPEVLSHWQEHAVMLYSGHMGGDSSNALTTLGDYLVANDWVEAGHCWYVVLISEDAL